MNACARLVVCCLAAVAFAGSTRAACPASVSATVSNDTVTIVASTSGQCGATGISIYLDGHPIGGKSCNAPACTFTDNRTYGYDDLNRLVVANTGAALWGTGTAGEMIVHEFAHHCWWQHGQRRGNNACNGRVASAPRVTRSGR